MNVFVYIHSNIPIQVYGGKGLTILILYLIQILFMYFNVCHVQASIKQGGWSLCHFTANIL